MAQRRRRSAGTGGQRDQWAHWLLERRFGGSSATAEEREQFMGRLWRWREEILDRSGLRPGEVLLDVGCGDGLIAFGALERGAGQVIFSDISLDLLAVCRAAAEEFAVTDRCQFVEAAADELTALEEASVDVVTTRAVLIYVERKQQALQEFFRLLRPGGRISLREPINRFSHQEGTKGFWFGALYPAGELSGLAEKLSALYAAIQPPEEDPMLNFDERDLIRYAEEAGFFPVELKLEAEVRAAEPRRWETFLHSSGNPKIPSVAEAMEQVLSPEERKRVEAHLRPLVEQGRGIWRMADASLSATKPS